MKTKLIAAIALSTALPTSAVAAPPAKSNTLTIQGQTEACQALQSGRPLAQLPSDPEAFGRACGVPTQAQLTKIQAGITKQQIEWSHLMQVRQRIESMKRALAGGY
jgi:hypothetical protein